MRSLMSKQRGVIYMLIVLTLIASVWLIFFTRSKPMEPLLDSENTPQEETVPAYLDPYRPVAERVADLLSRMTFDEKIGQMVQISKDGIRPGEVKEYCIGSVLSAGGGFPLNNTPTGWLEMVNGFQAEALETRLGIPLLYGVDAVHGHGNMIGATIFPHQIGLGASRNPDLVRRIGEATAREILATGIAWNFAPVVVSAQDIRWGRTYETYSEDIAIASELATAYLVGLQSLPQSFDPAPGQTIYTLATPKHFLGDGGTEWGTSQTADYQLDQGDKTIDETQVRSFFLPPYQHLIISDLNAVQQLSDNYYEAVVTAVNAGVDMIMISSDFKGLLN
jgi:beta-glucosidase